VRFFVLMSGPGIGPGFSAELGSACKVVGGEDAGASVGSTGPTPARAPGPRNRGTASAVGSSNEPSTAQSIPPRCDVRVQKASEEWD
jgi:hypothetical protein